MAQIKFEVDVSQISDLYGVTLVVFDDEDTQDEEEAAYFLVFRGSSEDQNLVSVAQMFGLAHQEAMTSVGLAGELTAAQAVDKLEQSIELAGELMRRHGFAVVTPDNVELGLLTALFDQDERDGSESDPSLLN